MRTVTKPKLRQFRDDILTRLQSDDKLNAHAGWSFSPDRLPYTTVELRSDRLAPYSADQGYVRDAQGRFRFKGETQFVVVTKYAITQRDQHRDDLLFNEAARIESLLVDAIKYGAAIENFRNSTVQITYHDLVPTDTLWAAGDNDTEGYVMTSGTLYYTQQDL